MLPHQVLLSPAVFPCRWRRWLDCHGSYWEGGDGGGGSGGVLIGGGGVVVSVMV